MTTSGNAATAGSTTSSPASPATASASTKKKCSPSPNAKGWTGDGAWVTCSCQWYSMGHESMRAAKRQFTLHKLGQDPA